MTRMPTGKLQVCCKFVASLLQVCCNTDEVYMREKISRWFYEHGWLWIACHISKEAVLWDAQRCTDAYKEGFNEGFKEGKTKTDFQIRKSQIPTAKVAYLKKSHQYHNGYECSNCGIAYPENIKNGYVVLNYCSKCGAKFVEGQG